MNWESFVKEVRDYPVIEVETLLSEDKSIRVQISRWVKMDRLIQAKRGIYVLSEPFRKIEVYEPYLASILKRPSYISLEKALEYHNLIPERVPVFSSVTTKRPSRFTSKLGVFDYHHIKPSLFWGYSSVTVRGQTGFIARPEKALFDLLYLRNINVSLEFLDELRLQNMEKLSTERLFEYARRFNKSRITRAGEIIGEYIEDYMKKEKVL